MRALVALFRPYTIDRGIGRHKGTDFVFAGGARPVGVITKDGRGRTVTCTIEGQRTRGANGECVIGERPRWAVRHARRTGLIGARRGLGTPKRDGLRWFDVTYAYAGHDRGDQATARAIYSHRVRAANAQDAVARAETELNARRGRHAPRFVIRSAVPERWTDS